MSDSLSDREYAGAQVVWMNYRYAGAWQEVSTRITQRQNALNIFVTLSIGIVTILLASPGASTSLDPNLFSMLLPLVSLAFGLLNYKHDKTIALLRAYLAECEMCKDGVTELPGYNSSPLYRQHAESTRRLHDVSCAFLLVFFNIVGYFAAHRAYPEAFKVTGWPVFVYFVCVLLSIWLVLRAAVRPHRFTKTPTA